jgi:hypothetical protein
MIFFAEFNDQMISLKLWGLESIPLPLYAIIYILALFVIILMSFVGVSEKLRLRGEIRRLKKENKALNAEIAKYKEIEEVPAEETAPVVKKEKPKPKKKKFTFTKKEEKAPKAETKEEETGL